MIVKDFIKQADLDKQVDLICSHQVTYEKPYDRDKVRKVQDYFINKLQNIKPKNSEDGIIVFERIYDIDEDLEDGLYSYIAAEYYHKSDIEQYLDKIKNESCPVKEYKENDNGTNLRELCYKFITFPIAYAYEFEDWEKILGWTIYEGNLNSFDIQECIYAILNEMSFNGVTEEEQEERREELDNSIKESEEIRKLPKEEQEKHYISWEEIKKRYKEEFDWEGPTEEEMLYLQQKMWLAALKNSIWRFDNFKKMAEVQK